MRRFQRLRVKNAEVGVFGSLAMNALLSPLNYERLTKRAPGVPFTGP